MIYQSEISNTKWKVYAILADIGWILFFIALTLCLIKAPELFENQMVAMLLLLDCLSAILIFRGLLELLLERTKKFDRILSGKRLARGFGALTIGGGLGTLFSLLAIALSDGLRGVGHLILLCCGGLLCGVFSGFILKEYKRK